MFASINLVVEGFFNLLIIGSIKYQKSYYSLTLYFVVPHMWHRCDKIKETVHYRILSMNLLSTKWKVKGWWSNRFDASLAAIMVGQMFVNFYTKIFESKLFNFNNSSKLPEYATNSFFIFFD